MEDILQEFKGLIIDRSEENIKAFITLFDQGIYGPCMAILRQELDSLIRVCYLHTQREHTEFVRLIKDTINGIQWKKNGKRITDRAMVDLAMKFNHWAPEVYNFGNCFIHLSNYHAYKISDPIKRLPEPKKDTIRKYLNQYHNFPINGEIITSNIIPYIHKVMDKVSHNLNSYLETLTYPSKN